MQQDPNDFTFKQAISRLNNSPEDLAEAEELVRAAAIAPIVNEEPPYLLYPSAKAMEEEALHDPTYPHEEGTPAPKRRRGPQLTEDQQMQLAVWQASGLSYAEGRAIMTKEWGSPITRQTWLYYMQVRKDLVAKAAMWIAEQFSLFGMGSPIVRYNRLVRHFELLTRYIEQRGLYEAETHVVGYGKNEKVVTSEKFTKDLSAEWRATAKQIEEVWGKIEKHLPEHGAGAPPKLDDITSNRFLQAAAWKPEKKDEE